MSWGLEYVVLLPSLITLGFNMIILVPSMRIPGTKFLGKLPKVSIIVAAWNEGPRIGRCIESLLKMDYPRKNMEIIVVGGGEDDTSEVCRSLARRGKIKFFEEKNRSGKWFALNRGVAKAKHDSIAFTDADGVVGKKWLKTLASNTSGDIIVSPALALHDDGHVGRCFSVASAYTGFVASGFSRLFNASAFSGVGSFMKKSIAKKIKFEKSYVEDYKFCQRAVSRGYRVIVDLNAPVYQGRPQTFGDWKKCYLRLFKGFITEMMFLKDVFSIFLFSVGILTLVSIMLMSIATGVPVNALVSISILLYGTSLATLVLISRFYKSTKYLMMAPYLAVFYVFVHLVGAESFFKILLRKNIGWPIYNKT